ncbi:MAG: MaoC family dehydratase [bacterium]|nr:MAG: MaoC family dehydratase [bacterium]
MEDARARAIEGIRAGDVFVATRIFTDDETLAFADLSLDYNPIHFDRRFTETKGFRGPVCHGLLVGGMVTEIGGQIGMLASGMNFRFRKPVYFGDTVTCRLTVDEMDDRNRVKCSAVFANQDGDTVIEAQLFGIVPGPVEREVMVKMVEEGDPTNRLRGE